MGNEGTNDTIYLHSIRPQYRSHSEKMGLQTHNHTLSRTVPLAMW